MIIVASHDSTKTEIKWIIKIWTLVPNSLEYSQTKSVVWGSLENLAQQMLFIIIANLVKKKNIWCTNDSVNQ